MIRETFVLLAFVALLAPSASYAQAPPVADPGQSVRTRADLQRLLQTYEEVLRSPAYSESVKANTRALAERLRMRLEHGDFRLGDRIVLYVEGEPELPDTLTVQAGPSVTLPLFATVSLAGVLRSEIQAHLTQELRRFIREPVVQAEGLMRMSIQGAVTSPGFYVVPARMLLEQTIMVAGGPASNANLNDLRIERGAEVILEGEELQRALQDGLTVDQLNLQAGDQILLPARSTTGFLTNMGVIVGIVGSLGVLLQIFG